MGELTVSGIFEADAGKERVALRLFNAGRMKLYTGPQLYELCPIGITKAC